MKQRLNFLILTVFIVMFPLSVFAAPDPNFHIYLMVGQSNMEGAATIEASDRVTNPRVMVLQDETCPALEAEYGQWRLASPPLIRCLGSWGLGPGDMFGQTMAEQSPSAVTIGLVGAAHGGQKIEYFLKDCATYDACTPSYGTTPNNLHGGYAWLLDLAQKAQQRGVIKGIIFHQGESNTGDPAWPGRVNQLVTDIRHDLGIGDVPFIAGELPYPACCFSHNVLVRQLPSIISNAYVVTAEGLDIRDKYHWNSAGVREMGRRYATQMLAALADPEPGDSGETGGDSGDVSVAMDISNDWGSGYCTNLVITNETSTALTWHVDMTIEGTVNNLWNGNWNQAGAILHVSGLSGHEQLQPGETNTAVGFCATRS